MQSVRQETLAYTATNGRTDRAAYPAALSMRAGPLAESARTIWGGACMIHHVLGLFTHPEQEWKEIRGEEESISHMYLTHVLILAAIPAVSAYIGTT